MNAKAILAIDPGNVQSAYCLFSIFLKEPIAFGTLSNEDMIHYLNDDDHNLVIEKVACMGMPVGETTFETVFWSGKFARTAEQQSNKVDRIARETVKLHLCGTKRAKDSNVIQALKDRFGGKGTKKKQGVLYGIKKDEWQALAVAVTYAETML
jgi:hypothetical protein